jgi:glyoxylase-like metal-dependent hydrolase (beta-lactamase superfamily II)
MIKTSFAGACATTACTAIVVAIGLVAHAQTPAAGGSADGALRLFPVQGNVSMLMGPAGNVAVQTGKDGVLLVDSGSEALAPAITAQVRTLTTLPLRYIINTSADADHTGGNAPLTVRGVTVIAHENVVNRMARPTPGRQPGLPDSEYFTPTKDFYFNGEPVFVIHAPNAHTDGDSMVLFRRSDVLSVGDVFTPDRFPMIDLQRGGSVQGLLDALNRILVLAVPERLQDGGTRVIPGHGRLCNEADVVEYRDMVTIVRDRIEDAIRKGMTLDAVKATRPTLDYDGIYGNASSFIDAVYNSLRQGPGERRPS